MTAKEKAIVLYNKFFAEVPFLRVGDNIHDDKNAAKHCAIICCDEILKELDLIELTYSIKYFGLIKYWQEVKEEINKL